MSVADVTVVFLLALIWFVLGAQMFAEITESPYPTGPAKQAQSACAVKP